MRVAGVPPTAPAVPPPVFAVAAGLLQHLLSRHRRPSTPSRTAAALVAAVSIGCATSAAVGFARRGTTVDPHVPARASALVTTGANRFTRNPMYLGMTGLLVAHASLRRSVSALVPVAAFVLVLDRWQVPAEEAALRERFGDAYDDYCDRVPRWLGRPSTLPPAGVTPT